MRCRQVEERLSSLVDGELPVEEAAVVQSHLESCARCAGEVVALRDLGRRLRAWDEKENRVAPSRAFRRRVIEAARADAAPRARRALRHLPGRSAWWLAAGSLAAAAALLVAAMLLLPGSAGSPVADTAADEVASRRMALDASDVDGHVALARWCEERGLRDDARGVWLQALAADPECAEALAALGLTGSGTFPFSTRPSPSERRERLRGLPRDLHAPVLARAPRTASPAEETLDLEGHELTRRAARDYIQEREREQMLAGEMANRHRSLAKGPEPVPSHELHPLAAFVARLEPIRPAQPNSFGSLVLLPIIDRVGERDEPDVLIADVAFRQGELRVHDHGNEIITLENRSERDVYVPAGTIFAGSTQDRITGRSVIVRAGAKTPVKAFCCEEGQATHRTSFRETTGIAGPGLRRLVLKEADQNLVWERIRQQAGRTETHSRTGALRAVYREPRVRQALKLGRQRLLPLLGDARVVGFVAADGDRILGADVFGSHEIFASVAGRFLDSYLVDALTDRTAGGAGLTLERARSFLQGVVSADAHERTGAGLGTEARMVGEALFAYGLADGRGRPVHVSLFPVLGGNPSRPPRKAAPPEPPESGTPGGGQTGSGAERTDPTESGRRIRDRREGVRRGAPSAPRPLDPPPSSNRPRTPPDTGSRPGGGSAGRTPPSPRDDLRPPRR